MPLQPEDVEYYRYHPVLLNAAFLGDLSEGDQLILGFGDKRNYVPHHERRTVHSGFHGLMSRVYRWKLASGELRRRIWGKCKRLVGLGR